MLPRMKSVVTAVFLGAALATTSCHTDAGRVPVDFAAQIKPLLEKQCINCHHSGALFGDLNLENRQLAFKVRPNGPVITPGEPEKSPFYKVLTLPEPERKAMPPTGHRIPQPDVEMVRRWIQEGAKWPDGPEGVIKPLLTAPGKTAV